jgi:DNA polymerase III delta subunit
VARSPGKGAGRLAGLLAPEAFAAALRSGAALPAAVAAAGSESFLQDQVIAACVGAALGDPDSPDAVVLHGPAKAGDADAPSLGAILEDAATPSMFAASGRKVVVVRRADHLLAADADLLEAWLGRPAPGSLLVFAVEASPGSRSTPAKVKKGLDALAAKGAVVSCDAPSAEPGRGGGASPLGAWVASRARARGKRLDPVDGDFLVHRSGTALATLEGAVAAAALHAGEADRITAADLEAVAPRGPAESTDRFAEALLSRDAEEALRVLSGLYREGAYPWGAKTPTRGDGPVTFLLVNQVRRLARDARTALGGGVMPPSLRFGCRDPRRILRRSDAPGLAGLLAAVTVLESELKSGASGGERARFEALVVRYAGTP